MTEEQIKHYRQAAKDGTIPDQENPLFVFSMTSTSLLAKLLTKEFNVTMMIRRELRDRGVNDKGQWVGFVKNKQKMSR